MSIVCRSLVPKQILRIFNVLVWLIRQQKPVIRIFKHIGEMGDSFNYSELFEQALGQIKSVRDPHATRPDTTIMTAAGFGEAMEITLPDEVVTAIEDRGFWESIPLWAVSLIGSL